MSNKQRGLLIMCVFVISNLLISACQMSASSAPAATPTALPTGQFTSALPTGDNPMNMIAEFAKQTSVAQTTVANGGTPLAPQQTPATTGTVITAQPGGTLPTATPTVGVPNTPTNAAAVATTPAVASTPSGPTTTPVPAGVRPATYTLQNGEFPYCIARRFNVDPDELLSLSGLTSPDLYYPGLKLTIPQSGAFPGDRMLTSHPSTYTVASADENLYSIACKFGDVDPASLASANGISLSAALTIGQQIKVP